MTSALCEAPSSTETGVQEEFTILTAGSQDIDRKTVDRLCRRRRWRAEHSSCCEEAIRQIEARRPAVVIATKGVPGGGWRRIVEQLSRLPFRPAVIVASDVADSVFWGEVLSDGASDLLETPLDLSELEMVVGAALESALRAFRLTAWRDADIASA